MLEIIDDPNLMRDESAGINEFMAGFKKVLDGPSDQIQEQGTIGSGALQILTIMSLMPAGIASSDLKQLCVEFGKQMDELNKH